MPAYQKTYAEMKRNFEENIACLKRGGTTAFVRAPIMSTTETVIMGQSQLIQHYNALNYYEENDEKVLVKYNFIQRWLHDPARRTVCNVVCEPDNTDRTVMNIWMPFRASRFDAVVQPEQILNKILGFASSAYDNADELLRFFAYTVQYPNTKLPYILAIVGDDWYTSSILVHFFGQMVVGPYLYKRLYKFESKERIGQKLLSVDSAQNAMAVKEIWGEYMTPGHSSNDTTWFIQNKANIIMTTDETFEDENFRVIQCTKNALNLTQIESYLNSTIAARCFYDYLMLMNLPTLP